MPTEWVFGSLTVVLFAIALFAEDMDDGALLFWGVVTALALVSLIVWAVRCTQFS